MRKTAYIGVFSALAVVLGYLENMIPLPVNIPGVRIGLSNICIITALFMLGAPSAFFVALIKALVCGTLFWGMQGAVYALFGTMLSFAVMIALRKPGVFSPVGVSALGAVFHNFGQLAALYLFTGSFSVIYYMSVLGLSGVLMGALTGAISLTVIKRIDKTKK